MAKESLNEKRDREHKEWKAKQTKEYQEWSNKLSDKSQKRSTKRAANHPAAKEVKRTLKTVNTSIAAGKKAVRDHEAGVERTKAKMAAMEANLHKKKAKVVLTEDSPKRKTGVTWKKENWAKRLGKKVKKALAKENKKNSGNAKKKAEHYQ